MKPITIADLANNATINAEELALIVKDNFGDRAATPIEITKDTKVEEFPQSLHGQIGLAAWACTES